MLKNLIILASALTHIYLCRTYNADAWCYMLPLVAIPLLIWSCFIKLERMNKADERGEIDES